MHFESMNEDVEVNKLTAPQFDHLEDDLYLFLNDAPSFERAEAARRDITALSQALGRLAHGER